MGHTLKTLILLIAVSTWALSLGLPAAALAQQSSPNHATLWIGLKNSDDQGTRFDLRVEVRLNGNLVATGVTRCITGVTRNATQATEVSVPVDVELSGAGGELSLTVSTRIGTLDDGNHCGGHSNAVGLRLYYDAVSRPAHLDVTFPGEDFSTPVYLHSDGGPCMNKPSPDATVHVLDEDAPTATQPKCRDSGGVNFKQGNPWQVIGTWSLTLEPETCDVPSAQCRHVFVTSEVYTGNLGGLAGADMKCQDLALAAGLPGTYKAWLSDSMTDAFDRMSKATVPYARTDGIKVADDFADLTDGALAAPINVDEGRVQRTLPVWTGTTPAGLRSSPGGSLPWCGGNWTRESSASGLTAAVVGASGAASAAWTDDSSEICSEALALYCVEQ